MLRGGGGLLLRVSWWLWWMMGLMGAKWRNGEGEVVVLDLRGAFMMDLLIRIVAPDVRSYRVYI